MDDDLHRPLGRDQKEERESPRWRIGPRRVAAAILALVLTAIAALFLLAPKGPLDATLGGRPYPLAKIEPFSPPPEPAAKPVEAAKAQEAPPTTSVQLRSADARAQATSEVEVQNGVRVLRGGGGGGANPLIIEVEPRASARPAPAPEKRVVE